MAVDCKKLFCSGPAFTRKRDYGNMTKAMLNEMHFLEHKYIAMIFLCTEFIPIYFGVICAN